MSETPQKTSEIREALSHVEQMALWEILDSYDHKALQTIIHYAKNSIPMPNVSCGHSEHDCFVKINGSTVYADPFDLEVCTGLAIGIRTALGLDAEN
jgi:hypothetical protein